MSADAHGSTEAGGGAFPDSNDNGAPRAGGEPAFQFKDRRRIDPTSGAVRSGARLPDPGSAAADPGNPANAAQPVAATVTAASQELAAAKQEAAERTADLQRISAEYANYRKRTDRDRALATTAGKAIVIGELLSVLDDVDLAQLHGDLAGPFKAVADRLTDALQRQGLVGFGAEGDAFDPTVHEAVQFGTSPDVEHPTVTMVFRRGYTLSDRVLRPAVVVVTGPEHGAAAPAADEASAAAGTGHTADAVDPIADTVDTGDAGDTVDPVDTGGTVDPVDPVDTGDTVEQADTQA